MRGDLWENALLWSKLAQLNGPACEKIAPFANCDADKR